jgi:DNA polymerase-3 subunit alpha
MSYTFCDGISQADPQQAGHVTLTIDGDDEGSSRSWPSAGRRGGRVKTLLALAQKLEGMTRNIGMHAGGVLIAPGKLTDFCPLYQQPGSDSAVSQYDKDDVEAIGLVKFDFLGLATLTILETRQGAHRRPPPGPGGLCLREPAAGRQATYKLFPTAAPKPCSSLKAAACRACCATPNRAGWRT